MTTPQQFRNMALALDGVTEQPHANRQAFKARIIFATLDEQQHAVNLKLPLTEQYVFCKAAPESVAAVSGGWGQQGWTSFNLKTISRKLLQEALSIAHAQASSHR